MTVTSRFLARNAGEDILRAGSGLLPLGAGGRGFAGGFISNAERERVGLPFCKCGAIFDIGELVILLRGVGDRDSPPDLGGSVNPFGDWREGRLGLFGRSGGLGSGLLGGSSGVDTLFNDLRVSFFRKSFINACLLVAWGQDKRLYFRACSNEACKSSE